MTDTKQPPERRVVLPVDPARRTEIDKQRVPMSARPYRLLALVKQDAVVRVQKEPDDTVMTWPRLLLDRFPRTQFAVSILLLLISLFMRDTAREATESATFRTFSPSRHRTLPSAPGASSLLPARLVAHVLVPGLTSSSSPQRYHSSIAATSSRSHRMSARPPHNTLAPLHDPRLVS